jgi:hypothetical protein
MAASKQNEKSEREMETPVRASKKNQILSLHGSGITDVEELAILTDSRPSYVASVLEGAEKLPGYFDLYTSTNKPMNVYSKAFARRLGFRDEEAARRSVKVLNYYYDRYAQAGDRAGQHHALVMALTMFDRARWTGKGREANIFRQWLSSRLAESEDSPQAEDMRAPSPGKARG